MCTLGPLGEEQGKGRCLLTGLRLLCALPSAAPWLDLVHNSDTLDRPRRGPDSWNGLIGCHDTGHWLSRTRVLLPPLQCCDRLGGELHGRSLTRTGALGCR